MGGMGEVPEGDKGEKRLRGTALECISLIGVAVRRPCPSR
jgi:hypothetical protein